MKKTFVELAKEFADSLIGAPDEAYIWALRFAKHLDAQGIKPKKSRWVKFEATADSVCPVPIEQVEAIKWMDGSVCSKADEIEHAQWDNIHDEYYPYIIAYKVKKEKS